MNILYVLYEELSCNSASHVDGIARELCGRGDACLVAVPKGDKGRDRFDPTPYRVATFDELVADPRRFPDGRGPDLVHVWNPRETNRKFHTRLASVCDFQTLIHLEDNEDHIVRTALGPDLYALTERGAFPGEYPDWLTHPHRSVQFMARAAGFTLLIDTLAEKLPPGAPHAVFWPATDTSVFRPRPRNDALRQELGIGPDVCVLAYHGNVHGANFHEVRSLYLATALLNRRGVPARLLRLGSSWDTQPPEYHQWTAEFCLELGFVVDRQRIADVLAAADVFVQPGTSDPFNDYRFPSKVPEFYALGRPVVLPRTNLGRVTRHGTDAYVLDEANGAAICTAVAEIWTNHELRDRLTRGAREFFDATFASWRAAGQTVARFYDRVLGNTEPVRRAA